MPTFSRRGFVALTTGAVSAGIAGVAGKAVEALIPYVVWPEPIRPGTWNLYATTCRECPAGCGIHLRHLSGRAVKADGSPTHPVSHGRLCARGQSSVQGLYDPDRIRTPLRNDGRAGQTPITWDQAIAAVAEQLVRTHAKVTLVSDLQSGAHAEVLEAFAKAFGGQVLMYEPLHYQPLVRAWQQAGVAGIPQYRLDRSDMILSLGVDFLETWLSPVELAGQFATMRQVRGDAMGRFIYIGPRLSMTAGSADEVILVEPGQEAAVAWAILRELAAQSSGPNLEALRQATAGAWKAQADACPLPASRVKEIARLLSQARAPVVLAGPAGLTGPAANDSALAGVLATLALNKTGSQGPVDFARTHALSAAVGPDAVRAALAQAGPTDAVFALGANPLYAMPGIEQSLANRLVVSIGTMPDETACKAHWALPADSPLEMWGDFEPWTGMHSLVQPTMARLYDTRHPADVLLQIAAAAGKPLSRPAQAGPASAPAATPFQAASFPHWLQQRWRSLHQRLAGATPFEDFWRESLQAGGRWEEPPAPARAAEIPRQIPPPTPAAPPAAAGQASLWVYPSIFFFDGRTANRSWLQEAPDPVSYVTWGSWIDVHPELAGKLGLTEGSGVEVRKTSDRGGLVLAPVRVTADVAPHTIALALGQGHTALGQSAAGRGANAFAVLEDLGWSPGLVAIKPAVRSQPPVYAAGTQIQHGREVLRWAGLEELRRNDPAIRQANAAIQMPLPEGYDPLKDMYAPHEYPNHRWAMVIDLHRCTGCGACAVACYAENNVAVVGPEEVARGREMAWLQVVPYRQDATFERGTGVSPVDGQGRDGPATHGRDAHATNDVRPRLGWLPMLCQHCDAAPCEPVCPVYAAVHNEEGLNAQVYNRCIGTRYCSNNCPYKVRRFNWFDHNWPTPLDWQLNPDVTVRCRGVMEKCTFCIQRIKEAEQNARKEGRPLRDGEIQPACVGTCPTGALVFGDLMDASCRVSELTRQGKRRYQLLADLNTKPAVTFLMRVWRDGDPAGGPA